MYREIGQVADQIYEVWNCTFFSYEYSYMKVYTVYTYQTFVVNN